MKRPPLDSSYHSLSQPRRKPSNATVTDSALFSMMASLLQILAPNGYHRFEVRHFICLQGGGAGKLSGVTRVPTRNKEPHAIDAAKTRARPLQDEVHAALTWLKSKSSKRIRDEMGPRYGIQANQAFGVSMSNMKQLAKQIGRNHQLAAALWETGWYEARMLASMVDEPSLVTPAQMDRWCRDFDNWGICDTVCFVLFDRTPHAFGKVKKWCNRRDEFVKRAAFALLACLALHDKEAEDEPFVEALLLIERGAVDERNFVKKSVSWALRAISCRNHALKSEALKVARRLAGSENSASRWIGRDALRKLGVSAGHR